MKASFRLDGPDRLVIREGGGCISVFGTPFLAAGVLLLSAAAGLVPGDIATDPRPWARPALAFMGLVFTGVGGALVFGRQWIVVDRAARVVLKQLGLLIPLHETRTPLEHYTIVSMGFVEGDSDSADRFPLTLKVHSIATGAERSVTQHHASSELKLCDFTDYGQARACATAIAQHLTLSFEDASSDHAVNLNGETLEMSLRERVRREGSRQREELSCPPGARSVVTREADRTTIVIPNRPANPLTLIGVLIPVGLLLMFGRTLLPFFRQTHTPEGIIWVFGGFFTLAFALPTISALNGFIRSRRGATIIQVSRDGLRVDQRGAWTSKMVGAVETRDIVDVDYSSRSTRVASARKLAAQRTQQMHSTTAAPPPLSPRLERVISVLTHFATGKGIVVKTRERVITCAQGLDDDETKYVYGVVRRALVD